MASDASVRTKNQETRVAGTGLGDRSVSDATKAARSPAKKKGHLLAFCGSPLTDSNRRPPAYHEREEGADPCGFARSGAGASMSAGAARSLGLHGGATLVRPGHWSMFGSLKEPRQATAAWPVSLGSREHPPIAKLTLE